MFHVIGDALYTKIQTLLTQDGGYVATVYNYDPKPDSTQQMLTPCIIIRPREGEENILDTGRNELIIRYEVQLLDDATQDIEAMEANMRSLADRLLRTIKDLEEVQYSE